MDLALVLAVDISLSMDADEQRLQREGYVAAFRDTDVHRAIGSGQHGRIAVAYLEWAGDHLQSVVMPWRVIASPADAEVLARELAAAPIRRERMTSISGALQKAGGMLAATGTAPVRRVVDVSGDGPNNSGAPVLAARREVLAAGIVINGLAIQLPRPAGRYRAFDLPDLDRYYADCVIGGPGSFVIPVTDKASFASAIRRKLLLEISSVTPARPPRMEKAQFVPPGAAPAYDCLVGEKRWRDYIDDSWRN